MYEYPTNFVAQAPSEVRNVRVGRPKWPYIGAVLLIIIVVLVIAAVPYALLANNIYNEALAGKANLEEAQNYAVALKFDGAREQIDDAVGHFISARRSFIPFKIFIWMPWIGRQIKAVDSLLETGVETSEAVGDLLEVGEEIYKVFELSEEIKADIKPEISGGVRFIDLDRETKREILKKLYESGPRIQEALVRIDLAISSFSRIPQDDLAKPLRDAIAPFADKLPEFKKQLTLAVPLVKILPELAGYPEPKNYLILLSNNAELRPAGGFLGTYGIFKVADGEILDLSTHDVYALDRQAESFLRVDPPPPLVKYLKVNNWYMRDANWSPDFAASAQKVLWFYSEEARGVATRRGSPLPEAPLINFNGVISVNPTVVADILSIIGPITIENQTFNSENFIDSLEYQVEVAFLSDGTPRSQRKEIISLLSAEIIDKLFSLPAVKWIDVLREAERGLEEREIIVYENDPDIQESLEFQNWAGRVRSTDGDFLKVVDANLASLKTDPYVERQIKYESWFEEDGALMARVNIHYKNTAGFSWKTTRYRTYTRVYAPEGSELVSVTGSLRDDKLANPGLEPGTPDEYNELGKTVFGAFTAIEPGAQGDLVFTYKLPESVSAMIKNGDYNLYVEKQAGAVAYGLTLSLNFDKNLKQAEPAELESHWGDRSYNLETDLRVDRTVNIKF
ncbi:MAG: DUF4012 domain-containing protein [Patescibacteria group bacterium]|nr:DUF4012 domain-containing protein [Patescibacteria group bacterium]